MIELLTMNIANIPDRVLFVILGLVSTFLAAGGYYIIVAGVLYIGLTLPSIIRRLAVLGNLKRLNAIPTGV